MKIEEFKTFEYDCQDAQELLLLYVLYPEELTIDERSDANDHISNCAVCREELENLKWGADVFGANREYWIKSGIFGDVQPDQPAVEMTHEEIMEQRFQEGLNRAGNRRKRREHKERIAKIKRLVRPVSAVAACLVIGLGLFWAVNQYSKAENSSPTIASNQYQSSVKIELILGNSTEVIPARETIVTGDALKTLRINGNRQMVLNIGTQLSIEPYNLGCVVKLDKGEIYTEVEHDGKPFVVQTSHGRTVITGTTFNIKADRNKMDLVVVEGSVHFESEKGAVDVIGGYQSSIVALLQPTKPVSCDIYEITKWAKRQNHVEPVQLDISTKEDLSELAVSSLVHLPYCDLEDINFDVWIDQHREWFEREFPWTKRLQSLLAQDGIEVDTIDLLIESGDMWRFTWPEYSLQRILAEDPKVIKKIADQYDVEIGKLILSEVIQCKRTPNVEAFEKWLNAFKSEEPNLAISSIHTCVFLINMRSLAWYGVNEGHIQVENKQQVLDLLSEQVQIASNMLMTLNQLLLADKGKSVCLMAQYDEYIRNLKDNISMMMEIDKELCWRGGD